jgi:hypothetical protein
MDPNSSYMFNRVDGRQLGISSVEAAIKLLGTTGTDITKIVPRGMPTGR